ncbi:class F sortase [Planococcus lenghuensis]|uniref:Class F sortase n=1 Tax=Planococcus lenghuensis TaxID=2213202 RepID=A0A1Q2KYJ8_9BACL|nr:class F sortase [Planococcus lenghuensis]AQQ53280.1 hypothetical protein B0X71_09435 [Planococcus lenghuensis]
MNRFAKKLFLVYCLFLLTTLTDNPGFATNFSPIENGPTHEFVQAENSEELLQPALPVKEHPDETKTDALESASKGQPETRAEPETVYSGVTPASIELPAIGEEAEVIEVGLTEEGAMEAPSNIYQIGWFAPGTKPGEQGNAVMAGHVDGETSPGTFYNLKELEPGDEIRITGTNGKELTFIVTDKESYVPDKAPLEKIFGASSKAQLNLITCTGVFNSRTGNYEERLVIYTELSSDP